MVKMIINIEGMSCSMCEAHVNDTIRKAFPVKKVSSSHVKGTAEIITEEPLDQEKLKAAISATGYSVKAIRTEAYEKKKFLFF